MTAREPLLLDVVANAYKAGFDDPRFGPVTADELADADSASRCSRPRARSAARARPSSCAGSGRTWTGFLQEGESRALFLSSVWRQVPGSAQFVRQLKRKAGLAPDHWSEGVRAFRFTAESFSAPFRAA